MAEDIKIGSKIQIIRTNRGITQEKLAELSGLSSNFISKLERDSTKDISLSNLISITKALDISIDELLNLKITDDEKYTLNTHLLFEKLNSLDKENADNLSKNFLEIINNLKS
ncbi:helix-turn-helix domain-containing protein [Lactobacillus terrae]|uniref:helix-turn-helix domain-containing protein n=1 Tax=Lactobacillus terrae TaxID=2269374 RepID=UPI000C1B6C46|nr:helix-turn-helix transcriptional regulator [Lactobacillus terrae]